jgi:hypothetical protein
MGIGVDIMTTLNISLDARFKAVKNAMTLHSKELDSRMRRLMDDLVDIAERWIRREAPHRTGKLKSATRHEGSGDKRRVFVSKAIAPYFDAVHDGIKKKYTIYPKYKQALYWPGASHPVKSVTIKPRKGNPYVDIAFKNMLPDVDKKVKNLHEWMVSL